MIKSFDEAVKFVDKHIYTDPRKRFRGDFGLRGSAKFLDLLGNPQNELKVIHVAGTSGKGSTCFFASQILSSLGFKTSLTLSPHLVDMRERCQINNQLIPEKDFIEILYSMVPAIEAMMKTEFEKPSYFMILLGMFFLASVKHKVDYAVVETGFGGKYDGTNNINRKDKICIINRIGLDHTEILGDTVEKIAHEKAGIIGKGNMVFSPHQEDEARKVIENRAREQGATLEFVTDERNIKNPRIAGSQAVFTFKRGNHVIENISLATPAYYQITNCSLALAAVTHLADRDGFKIDADRIKERLKSVSFGGRMEIFNVKGKKLILDGAHNPQKMENFITSLKKIVSEKPCFLISFKEGKDYKNMLDYIAPLASKVIVTDFDLGQDMAHKSQPSGDVVAHLKSLGFDSVEVIHGSENAYKSLLNQKEKELVITGSLYLLSSVYPLIKKND